MLVGPVAAAEPVTYRQVAPLFAARCVKCHAERGIMGGPPENFRLTSYRDALDASDRARVVPRDPLASELVRRIRGDAQPRMPFDGPPYLSAEEIRLVERWVADGARDDDGRPAPRPVGARVRLHGQLTGQWELDGLPLMVGPGTRLDKRPAVGNYVEARGTVQPDGRISVTRLRRR